ncbi:MAG: hypothetical protein FWG35_05175 [Spirochaetaceae bacterium]|nr:hypothetical protein [Spirochaetaceae bacterium]
MKKFVVFFILLLGLAGTGFYFGWVQIAIPPQSQGVIFTKTGGWDATAVQPGVFAWRWEKLIPGNFTLYLYPDTTHTGEIELRGSLPSAEAYALVLDGNPSFGYTLRFSVSYRVRNGYFPVLAKEHGVLPEAFDEWLASLRTGIAAKGSAAVAAWFEKTSDPAPEETEKRLAESITALFAADYPFLEITGFAPTELSLPDTALYAKARELYLARAESRKDALRESAREMTLRTLREEARWENLKKYGELLTQYPVLLDYLKAEKELTDPGERR